MTFGQLTPNVLRAAVGAIHRQLPPRSRPAFIANLPSDAADAAEDMLPSSRLTDSAQIVSPSPSPFCSSSSSSSSSPSSASPWSCGPSPISIVAAMSGGVDSTVAAALLKHLGFKVSGIFMRNWDEREETGVCTSDAAYADVEHICACLDIPCSRRDFVSEYWTTVFESMLEDYDRGLTPNPDVLCNRHIKFDAFFHAVLTRHQDRLTASSQVTAPNPIDDENMMPSTHGTAAFIATGHYADKAYFSDGQPRLMRAVDEKKDQTYFLAGMPSGKLDSILFPLAPFTKQQVKDIASQLGFHQQAEQKESMGLCFVGPRRFSDFVGQYLSPRPGVFVDAYTGDVIDKHDGVQLFTIGQRARVSGKPERWFVHGKDIKSNSVAIGPGEHNPWLYSRTFAVSDLTVTAAEVGVYERSPLSDSPSKAVRQHTAAPVLEERLLVRCRHRGPLAAAAAVKPLDEKAVAAAQHDAEAQPQAAAAMGSDVISVIGHFPGVDDHQQWATRLNQIWQGGSLVGASNLRDQHHIRLESTATNAKDATGAKDNTLALASMPPLLEEHNLGAFIIELEEPLRAVVPGQYAVFYSESGECVGRGRIEAALPIAAQDAMDKLHAELTVE